MTVLGNRVLKEVIKSNEVIRVGPNPIRLVSLEEEEIRTQRHMEERLSEDTGRRQRSASQGSSHRRNQSPGTLISDLEPPEL